MHMIHVRLVIPAQLTDRVIDLLIADECVLNLVVLPGTAHNPAGDAIECDILAGAANVVLRRLRDMQVDLHGSVVLEPVDLALSSRARSVEPRKLGALAHAPVWAELEERIHADATYSPSFYLLIVIAGLIAAVGIFTNSQILIVGAMIVGPEYAAISAVALGIDRHAGRQIRQGLLAMAGGFTLAVAAAFLFALLVRLLGQEPTAFQAGIRPVAHMIDTPNLFSVVVATLAGIVGVVALTHTRSGTLIGVFVSVTTIPAAASLGVGVAIGNWNEAWGSLQQLLLNVFVLIVVGFLTLRVQRALWGRVERQWLASARGRRG